MAALAVLAQTVSLQTDLPPETAGSPEAMANVCPIALTQRLSIGMQGCPALGGHWCPAGRSKDGGDLKRWPWLGDVTY